MCSNAIRGEFSEPIFKIQLCQCELGWRFSWAGDLAGLAMYLGWRFSWAGDLAGLAI
jgi:hypothetical protein